MQFCLVMDPHRPGITVEIFEARLYGVICEHCEGIARQPMYRQVIKGAANTWLPRNVHSTMTEQR